MEQAPLVLIGARSEARGRQLEQRLMDDGRVAILGVHTRAEPLMRAVMSSPSATLLLDTALSDACTLEVLLRIQLRRPCPVIALCTLLGGEHGVEMVRAGALDCLAWEDTPASAAAVAEALMTAARTPPETLRLVVPSVRQRRSAAARPAATRLVLLIGSRRATLLCDALAHLPGDFPAALLCCQPVDRSTAFGFAEQLARTSALHMAPSARSALRNGTVYLFERSDRLVVDERSSGGISLRLQHGDDDATRDPLGHDEGELTWLDSMAASLSHRELDVVTISSGHLDAATIGILSRMLSVGVALARSVPGGYQIRWPDADGVRRFDAPAFWRHLHERKQRSAAQGGVPRAATGAGS